MKQSFLAFFLIFSLGLTAQTTTIEYEKYPVFPTCEEADSATIKLCFTNTLQQFIHDNFELPSAVAEKNYRGTINVLFEVSKEGKFNVLYVDGMYEELKTEVLRVFEMLPKVEPATYNGSPTYVQFTWTIAIPLTSPGQDAMTTTIGETEETPRDKLINEYDELINLPYQNEEYKSNINIPLSHHNYSLFDPAMNRVGLNSHTAQKPYTYEEVNKYYDFQAHNASISRERTSWFGRKFWNEHMVTIKGKDYWLTLDPGVDLQAGKDLDADINTYNNTRLVYTQGGIGKKLSFFAVIYESQGRFAGYYNNYAESIRAYSYPAIIPGKGIAKEFKTDSYDYPGATGHISYTPSKHFNVQLGHGKTFIGDGYRSLLMSDNASPYPFFKLNTTFWKLKYTNTWMSLRDVRPEVTDGGSYRTKYMANHYLSYNITKRLNIGLFESVVWENDNNRGFDFNYMNPVIFYRSIEFSTGARGGNALIGLSSKYKVSDRINLYGQFVIDEFSTSDVFGGNGSYKNKTGYQVGIKYYDAFGLKNLLLQAEYNRVRPYTYSHFTETLNYGHNNQSVAHTLGTNFSEFVAIARYQKGRLYGDAKLVVAKRGFDFNTAQDSLNYGNNIYISENTDRFSTLGNTVAQGNTTDFLHTELQLGYLINPATNLKIYGSLIFRDFRPTLDTEAVFRNKTTWVNFGIRTDLFNWYYDF